MYVCMCMCICMYVYACVLCAVWCTFSCAFYMFVAVHILSEQQDRTSQMRVCSVRRPFTAAPCRVSLLRTVRSGTDCYTAQKVKETHPPTQARTQTQTRVLMPRVRRILPCFPHFSLSSSFSSSTSSSSSQSLQHTEAAESVSHLPLLHTHTPLQVACAVPVSSLSTFCLCLPSLW
jgi:hypothetical protein